MHAMENIMSGNVFWALDIYRALYRATTHPLSA
jgi:hypothetical protein